MRKHEIRIRLQKRACEGCGCLYRPARRNQRACKDKCRSKVSLNDFKARYSSDAEFRRRVVEYNRRQRPKFKAKASARRREYERNRWRTDVAYRLRKNIGKAIRKSLLAKGVFKRGRRWEALVGFTAEQLRAHLEKRFEPGMTWENYGSAWHIDHVLPKSAFKVVSTRSKAFRECWALKNLRPLWGPANVEKSKSIDIGKLGRLTQ